MEDDRLGGRVCPGGSGSPSGTRDRGAGYASQRHERAGGLAAAAWHVPGGAQRRQAQPARQPREPGRGATERGGALQANGGSWRAHRPASSGRPRTSTGPGRSWPSTPADRCGGSRTPTVLTVDGSLTSCRTSTWWVCSGTRPGGTVARPPREHAARRQRARAAGEDRSRYGTSTTSGSWSSIAGIRSRCSPSTTTPPSSRGTSIAWRRGWAGPVQQGGASLHHGAPPHGGGATGTAAERVHALGRAPHAVAERARVAPATSARPGTSRQHLSDQDLQLLRSLALELHQGIDAQSVSPVEAPWIVNTSTHSARWPFFAMAHGPTVELAIVAPGSLAAIAGAT